MEANRFWTYPPKQNVPHSSGLVLFLNGLAVFLFCSGAIPRLAAPCTLAEFSLSALQSSQHFYNVYACTCIPAVFSIAYFFAAKPEGPCTVRFFHVNCMSQLDGDLFPLWRNTVPSV